MTALDAAARGASAFTGSTPAVRVFGAGHINETFLVEASTGALVLQRVNIGVFADPDAVMHNILAVHDHLHGRLVPQPVPAIDGRWLVRDASGVWRAWRRAPGAA